MLKIKARSNKALKEEAIVFAITFKNECENTKATCATIIVLEDRIKMMCIQ